MTLLRKQSTMILLATILSVVLLAQLPASNIAASQVASNEELNQLPQFPTEPDNAIKQDLIQRALNVDGVKNWSSSAWEPNVQYVGVSDPTPHWTKAYVELKLAPGKGNPEYACSESWVATIEFDLESNKITKADYPSENNRACAKGSIVFEKPSQNAKFVEEPIPSIIPTASAGHTFVIGTQKYVATANRYGAFAYLSTPQIDDPAIWTSFNHYVSETLNQDFVGSTPSYLQVGYLLTTEGGCTNCGIVADSGQFVYVDTSYWGDAQPRKIPGITYTENNSAISYIICDAGGAKVKERLWHNGSFWTRDSSVNCGSKTSNISTDNSVFFENANTFATSTWSGKIQTAVQGWSAKEYTSTTSYQNWQDSENKEKTCGGVIQATSKMTGTLKLAGTATWSMSSIAAAC